MTFIHFKQNHRICSLVQCPAIR